MARNRPQRRGNPVPLDLFQILEEEYVQLHGPLPEDHPGWELGADQLADLAGLAAGLRDPRHAAGHTVRSGFSAENRDALDQYGTEEGPGDEAVAERICGELNRLLDDPGLATREGFAELAPENPWIAEMRSGGGPQGEDLRKLNRRLLETAFPGRLVPVREVRLAAIYRSIHGLEKPRTALCLSGGGIRSASFGLGVVQGLARARLLGGFDYLSTVSGGGYLGGLLAAWIHRHPDGLPGVEQALAGTGTSRLDPEPCALRYLRTYSNYLSPKLGLLSADAWTLVTIYLRNLYLHWLVCIPLLLAALLLPRLYVSFVRWAPNLYEGFEQAPLLLFGLASTAMSCAIAYIGRHRPSGGLAKAGQREFFFGCLLPLLFSAFAFPAVWAWLNPVAPSGPPAPPRFGPIWFIPSTIAVNFLGWSAHVLELQRRGLLRWKYKLREIVPLVGSGVLGGSLTWLAATRLFPLPLERLDLYTCFGPALILGAFLAGETLFSGLVSRWTDDEDREWWARTGAWLLIAAAGWAILSSITVFGPLLLLALPWLLAPLGGITGLLTLVFAGSAKTAPSKDKAQESLAARLIQGSLATSTTLFLILFLAAVSLLTSALTGPLFAFSWLGPQGKSPVFLAVIGHLLPTGRRDALLARVTAVGNHLQATFNAPLLAPVLLLAAAVGIGLLVSWLMNINKFSLHALYRNRLIRAFLGASREERNPNPFTGFDPDDNVEMHRLQRPIHLTRETFADLGPLCKALTRAECRTAAFLKPLLSPATLRALSQNGPAAPSPELFESLRADLNRLIHARALLDENFWRDLHLSDELALQVQQKPRGEDGQRLCRELLAFAFPTLFTRERPPRPLPVVNVALNLVMGENLAWQQRKAEPFTFSPLHCGSLRLGYRRAGEYGRGTRGKAISLGTAVAISGAAASPNMGYHSSPSITLLMTLFNARLGWWLGNPGLAGRKTYATSHPRFGFKTLIAEALGLTNDANPYVYLSDGGHFENLGLYEMILRRCRLIVLSDAGQDPECRFEDLANAIRKIRIDLGVPIEFDQLPIRKEGDGKYCALGKIRYSAVDGPGTDGLLLYIKPAICGQEPRDILHYRAANPQFPHEPTSDQWFSESQFESYRMLGLHAVKTLCSAGWDGKELEELVTQVRVYLGEEEESTALAVVPPPVISLPPALSAL